MEGCAETKENFHLQESQSGRSHEASLKSGQNCLQHAQQERLPWGHFQLERQTRLLCPLSSRSSLHGSGNLISFQKSRYVLPKDNVDAVLLGYCGEAT